MKTKQLIQFAATLNKSKTAWCYFFEGKVKFKKKELKKFNDLFDKWFLTHPDYIHGIQMDKFERIFGKKLKAGEVRHGRLKLRLTKRKKK